MDMDAEREQPERRVWPAGPGIHAVRDKDEELQAGRSDSRQGREAAFVLGRIYARLGGCL